MGTAFGWAAATIIVFVVFVLGYLVPMLTQQLLQVMP